MPSRAKRDKERRWKLARNAVWGCVPARLGSEVPATWVPATELVPGGERAPWSSRSSENVLAWDLVTAWEATVQATRELGGRPHGRRSSLEKLMANNFHCRRLSAK